MTLNELKSILQGHLGDGLVVVVGSGLSCAEGMPGMSTLADYLKSKVPGRISGVDSTTWKNIEAMIDTDGLEAALLKYQPSESLQNEIMTATADLLLPTESAIIDEALRGATQLRFTRLIAHLLKPSSGIPVITTNYDRLIEVATELGGLAVDTMFVGSHIAVLNETESRLSFCRDVVLTGKSVRYLYRQRIVLYKPHGSFDWYQRGDQPVSSAMLLTLPRLIITPGLNKFRSGYDSPFDRHRDRANTAIDKAARFLIVGYGFNDDHLETHLTPRIHAGVPTVLITHTVSANARKVIESSKNFIAIHFSIEVGQPGTGVLIGSEKFFFPNSQMWDVGNFVAEVLEP